MCFYFLIIMNKILILFLILILSGCATVDNQGSVVNDNTVIDYHTKELIEEDVFPVEDITIDIEDITEPVVSNHETSLEQSPPNDLGGVSLFKLIDFSTLIYRSLKNSKYF